MAITLRTLIDDSALGLRLARPLDTRDAQLDAPISWAHSSNLEHPSPWLEPGQLLLTDGTQFGRQHSAEAEADIANEYVRRLRDVGVVGLGFAVNVVHARVPDEVVAACLAHDLPLVLVPSSTPFIRISRTVADAIAAERTARLEWSDRAQRAVARATLRPDGLAATLRELSTQLDSWVALYDALGRRVPVQMARPVPPDLEEELAEAVAGQLRGRRRASARLASTEHSVTLHTIGQPDRLRGVLAIGSDAPLDAAGAQLLASVVGIASIAIEQSRVLDSARRGLRTGVLELYLAGSATAAGAALAELGSWVPTGRIRVIVVHGAGEAGFLDELELLAASGRLAFARRGDELVLLQPDGAEMPAFIEREGLTAGVSTEVGVDDIAQGYTDARHAASRAARAGEVVEFDRLAEHGLLAWLDAEQGELLAARMLDGLRARPDADELIAALRVWFRHNCAWDPAARELGIHRHTLRSRIALTADATGYDLDDFAARAQLWLALELAR
ncbi:PucR family transcriptional regulator ligand-binding domain-containing protein [Gulosibacter faecalis]|uniref:PucR family transcriptional regulator ligand-binding domain-containing protein n=1 Tax=Gulosibacter faecalis TaxID=272240 RepID=A0ABW5UUT0_9MICO|nr:PucR family transcriptional regulator ligand-binding domain-containing protein [Gulosibacter faecalis]